MGFVLAHNLFLSKMEVFQKFDGPRGSVTPELLSAIYGKLGQEAPPKEKLEEFIESVYSERERAEESGKSLPEKFGVPPSSGNAEECIRRCYKNPSGDLTRNFEEIEADDRYAHQKNVVNMYDIFSNTVQKYPDNNFYGTSSAPGEAYSFATYSEVSKRVDNLASGLVNHLGYGYQKFVGIMLDTCPEWGITELALWRQAMVPVTLYSTYGKDAIAYIINHAELDTIFTSKKCIGMLNEVVASCPTLKTVVYLGEKDELKDVTVNDSIKIVYFSELESSSSDNIVEKYNTSGDDKSLIIYTSGTTGNPKGVVHRHSSLVAVTSSCISLIPFKHDDIYLAFLPMAHIMEQFLEALVFSVGGSIGFWSGDIRVLMTDVATLKPTKFIAVPRLLNRLYVQLRSVFNSLEGEKKAVYEAALASKKQWLAKGVYKSFYDLFVFNKSAAVLGGRCGLLATGSAPIDPGMLEFFRIIFSCPVIEGYGMTEVLITNLTLIHDTKTRSHVGPPSTAVEIKLVDVPEMNYSSKANPPRGEVCFRGPMNLVEYYKDPEKTKEAVDEDGWFHSGDIGEFYEDGSLRLIDRIKHIFKLSQGEYVAPEKLEQTFVHSKYVAQIFVNGNSLQSALVCVVVPDPTCITQAKTDFGCESVNDLFAHSDFKKLVLDDIEQIGRATGHFGFEIPRAVHFIETPFENLGLLTPTFKMKRNEARNQFNDICEELYKTL